MSTIKIACVGDSITFGYDIQEAHKWTTLLRNELQVEVLNFGINGDTTNGMLSRFNEVLFENPSLIIVTGGTNDLWYGLKDEQIIANINAMVKHAQHQDIDCLVGIPTPNFSLNAVNLVDEDYAECIRSFQNRLIKFCLLKEISYIDFSLGMKEAHYFDDGLHPNVEGQQVMMLNALNVLKKII
ncbi:GDSL-type esterase/lipase family protein [Seonamhaeicola sp.]|uniref:GDSL-type esterase/lipase family protein n=1 Tax=Seonamhaeicola sp. TaxID=1912245 RepID=UPI0026040E67|nr:GDSL-type esterase/lipase family protein [Seonamhaeicola sp.]